MPTIADALSVLRLALAFVFPAALARGGLLPVMLFVVAAVTDYIDGPIARRSGTVSARGGILDNIADIAFVLGGATAGAMLGLASWAAPFAITASVTGYVLASRDQTQREATTVLARSRVGHAAGVMNYVLAGTLAARQALAALVPIELVTVVVWGTVAVNTAAVGVRLRPR